MKLSNRQRKFVEALAAAGCVSPVSRQELIAVCDSSGIYTCPPSWITQDSTRKAGRGAYDLPELNDVSEVVTPAPVQPLIWQHLRLCRVRSSRSPRNL
jgi:hypothetical protein